MQQSLHKFTVGRRQWVSALIALALLCTGLPILFHFRQDPHYREVKQLVSQLGSSPYFQEPDVSTIRALARLGPKAYPALARLLNGHDTKTDELYDRLWGNLPSPVRRLLPRRQSKEELHQKAQSVIDQLGPAASRALVGAIHVSLNHPKARGDMELLRTLYWSIPESGLAVATLHDWLLKPEPGRMLFGMKDADEIWPTVPQLGSLLAQWLRFADEVRNAAEGLGAMGTNATFAVADLIDVFHSGVAGHPPNTNRFIQYAPGMDPLTWDRGAAIQALGNIGLASPEVLEVLTQAWADPLPGIRALSADAVGKLGPKALRILPALLARLDTSNRIALTYQVEAIGKIGPGAQEAVPILRHWADPAAVAQLPDPERLGHAIRWFDDPLPLPGGAAAALLQIAPGAGTGLGPVIAEALVPGPQTQGAYGSADKLRRLRPLAGEIIPALKPALQDTRQWVKQLTALQILCLQPDHDAATTVLVAAMHQPEPTLRTQAAVYYWRATGETNGVLEVFRETIRTVKDNATQPPLNYAAELGPVAKPLVPQIRALLTNDDWSIRKLAGKALRRIDPAALPPINERYP